MAALGMATCGLVILGVARNPAGLSGGPVLIGFLATAASLPTASLASGLLPMAGVLVLAARASEGVRAPGPSAHG